MCERDGERMKRPIEDWSAIIKEVLSAQMVQSSEITELRWDGSTELIRFEDPEKETMSE